LTDSTISNMFCSRSSWILEFETICPLIAYSPTERYSSPSRSRTDAPRNSRHKLTFVHFFLPSLHRSLAWRFEACFCSVNSANRACAACHLWSSDLTHTLIIIQSSFRDSVRQPLMAQLGSCDCFEGPPLVGCVSCGNG
jgi:hypothetical protein